MSKSNTTQDTEKPNVADDPRVIKKYPNRRVYDTSTSKYIKIDDIRDMVVQGINFTVIDSQSKKDITRSVLLQIIFDQESDTNPLFSSDNLQNFIRYSELKTDTFSDYLSNSLQFFNQQQQEMSKYLSGNVTVDDFNPFSQGNIDRWQTMQKQFFDSFSTGGSDKEK